MTEPFRPQPGEPHTTRHDYTPCPMCGHLADAATNFTARRPRHGDWSLCISCTAVNVFDVSPLGVVTLRAITPAELTRFENTPEAVKALEILKRFRQRENTNRD